MAVEPLRFSPAKEPPAVLVVEDEALVRLAIAEHLRRFGYRVLEAESAGEAIQLLGQDPEIRAALIDIRLRGGADGFGLLAWVQEYRPDVKAILASGYEQSMQEAQQYFPEEAFVQKPYDPVHVHFLIRKLMHEPSNGA